MKNYDEMVKKDILRQFEDKKDYHGMILEESKKVAVVQFGTVSSDLENNLIAEGYCVENVTPFCKIWRE